MLGINQAQWIRLSGLLGGALAVLNVYAPQTSPNRCSLFCELTHSLPTDYRLVLCGDWNVVESTLDKSSQEPRIVTDRERLKLELLISNLGVEDYFSHNQNIIYSWDNKKVSEERVMARLDWFYIFAGRNV